MKKVPVFLKEPVFYGQQLDTSSTLKDFLNDDIKREAAFLKQALQAAVRGREQILKAGLPFTRPETVMGASFKTVEQMSRAQDKIDVSAKQAKAIEESRKQRMLKKFAKQVQVEKNQQREQERKKAQTRLDRKGQPGSEDEDFRVTVEEGRKGKKQRAPMKREAAPNAKRQHKNQKFGFKRANKRNDRESSHDDSGFNVRKNRTPFKGAKTRPGKQRRQQVRSKTVGKK